MIPSMALFVMSNLFTWLKSKVNTCSSNITLEEIPLYSEANAQGLILRIKLRYTILFFKFGQEFFLNSGVWFWKLGYSVTFGF